MPPDIHTLVKLTKRYKIYMLRDVEMHDEFNANKNKKKYLERLVYYFLDNNQDKFNSLRSQLVHD